MLPFLLFHPAPILLPLVLGLGCVFADTISSTPLKGFTKPGSSRCLQSNKLNSNCNSNALPNPKYCTQYQSYCKEFTGTDATLPGYNAYCKSLQSNPCASTISGNKGSTAGKRSIPNHPLGPRRDYKSRSGFDIRADDTGNLTAHNLGVLTSGDLWYGMSVNLGGETFIVQLDTGSSDLWVLTANHTVNLTNTTDLFVSEAYGSEEVRGNIAFADLAITQGIVISSQAFLNVSDVQSIQSFDADNFDGIIGMAFDAGSIHNTVTHEWGADAANDLALSPMSALFASDPTAENCFDILLYRSNETEDAAPDGIISFSSHVSGYDAVAAAPQLSRVADDVQHWSVAMDGMLINGERFSFNQSLNPSVPAGSIVAALDTGSSFSYLSPAAVDAIYASIPGAKYDDNIQSWLVPCEASANLTFVFGGQSFPVHPLDLTSPVAAVLSINDNWDTDITVCANTYQYLAASPAATDGYDIILGVAFLRNAYASFNYGPTPSDPDSNSNGSTPFVQLLSATNASAMWDEFQTVRAATLSTLPLPLDPALIIAYEGGTPDDADQDQVDPRASASGAVADDAATLGGGGSWGDRHGGAVLGLLGAILVVCVVCAVLLVAGAVAFVRRRKD